MSYDASRPLTEIPSDNSKKNRVTNPKILSALDHPFQGNLPSRVASSRFWSCSDGIHDGIVVGEESISSDFLIWNLIQSSSIK